MQTPTKENRELVQQLVKAQNDNNPSKMKEVLSTNFVAYNGVCDEPMNREEYIIQVNLAHIAFKPLFFEVADIIEEKNKIAGRILVKGKHSGVYGHFTATQNEICFLSMFMMEIAEEKITKAWQVSDHLTMLKQIGLSVNHII